MNKSLRVEIAKCKNSFELKSLARSVGLKGYSVNQADLRSLLHEYFDSNMSSQDFNKTRKSAQRIKFATAAKNGNFDEAKKYLDDFTPIHIQNNIAFSCIDLDFFETLSEHIMFDAEKFEACSGKVVEQAIKHGWESAKFIKLFSNTGAPIRSVDILKGYPLNNFQKKHINLVVDLYYCSSIEMDANTKKFLFDTKEHHFYQNIRNPVYVSKETDLVTKLKNIIDVPCQQVHEGHIRAAAIIFWKAVREEKYDTVELLEQMNSRLQYVPMINVISYKTKRERTTTYPEQEKFFTNLAIANNDIHDTVIIETHNPAFEGMSFVYPSH